MSTALIIVIVIAAIVVVALLAVQLRRSAAEREIEQERLSGEAVAHRDQADSNVSRARERGQEAELHRRQADRTRREARSSTPPRRPSTPSRRPNSTAGPHAPAKAAAFHDEKAAEREEQLERP